MPDPTWVPGAEGSGFGIENLPYGVVRRGNGPPRPAVRVGDYALVPDELVTAGLLGVRGLEPDTFARPTPNPFLGLGRAVWSRTRARLIHLLDSPALRGCPKEIR